MIDILVAAFIDRWQPVEEMKPPQPVPELAAPPAAPPPAPHASAPRHRDVCTRHGGHREDYTKNHWRYWRCVYRRGQ